MFKGFPEFTATVWCEVGSYEGPAVTRSRYLSAMRSNPSEMKITQLLLLADKEKRMDLDVDEEVTS